MSTSRPQPGQLGSTGAEPPGPGAPDTVEALGEVLGAVPERLGAYIGGLYLVSGNGQLLDLLMTLGPARQFTRPWQHVGLAAPIPVVDAVRDGRTVWVAGPEELARRYPRIALAMPYAFCLAAVPLVSGGSTYGAVFLIWPAAHPAELSTGERSGLALLAGRLAGLLAAAARSGRPVRPGPRPVSIDPAVRTDTIAVVAERLPEGLCGVGHDGRLNLVTPTAAELLGKPPERLLGAKPWSVLPWLRDPIYDYHYRAAVISGQPTSFVALRPPDRWLSFRLYPDSTGLTVRIDTAAASRPEGAASVAAPEPLAHTRPGALYHILHLASALTEAATVQDVVGMVADQIVPAFGGQAVAVLSAEGGKLRIVGHRGYPPGLVDQFDGTSLTESTPGVQASRNQVPMFFENRAELERLYAGRRETQDGMAAWAYLPLVTSGRLIGTCVLAFAEPHRFGLEERAVLTSLGGLIAQALDRARLYDTKFEFARGLQDSLLPHTLPVVPGLATAARYLPASAGMEVGGDFYDIIPVDGDAVGVVIGDVQGHNVNAAALMGQVRTAVRAFATADADPGTVLARTNRLVLDLGTPLLASCAYLRVHPYSRQAWLADAGHPAPLLREPDGRTRPVVPPGGMVLNVAPDADYPQVRIAFPVGSTLLLYTDGLIERPGTDIGHSQAMLAAALARLGGAPLDQLADMLIGRVEHRADDIALLLIRSVPDGRGADLR